MADTPFAQARVVEIWLTLAGVESIHGVMRRLFLEPQRGDLPARQLSVVLGAVLMVILVAPRVLAERLGLIQRGQRTAYR